MENNKNIIVIGASSGYGLSIAIRLKSAGFNVIGASRSLPIDTEAGTYLTMDVRKSISVDNGFEEILKSYGKIYATIYCAGIAKGMNTITNGNPDWWEDVFQTNTMGLLRVIKNAIPQTVKGGAFIYLGSISSRLNYIGGADYCASKAASLSVMRNLRLELAKTGIRSITVDPGYAKTNFMLRRFDGDIEKADKKITPLETNDLAQLIEFILSQDNNVNYDEIIIKPLEQIIH